jgi:hypothetical protein
MTIFKYLIAAILFGAEAPSEIGENGWVAVEKTEQTKEVDSANPVDPSIWVAFAKQMGSEKILIQFPSEPTYRYMDASGEEMEVTSDSKGSEFRLQIIKTKFEDSESLYGWRKALLPEVVISSSENRMENGRAVAEFVYWKDGYWNFERLETTPHHTYFFHTKSAELDQGLHQVFVKSFDLQTVS